MQGKVGALPQTQLGPEAPDPHSLSEGFQGLCPWRGPGQSPGAQVRQFAELLAGTDIEQLELRTASGVLRVRRDAATAPPRAEPPPETQPVTAPSLGVFLHQHPMHDAPLAPVGSLVASGQIVGFLRIGALLLPVVAPQGGTVAEMAAAHGETVGYGATLLRLRAA